MDECSGATAPPPEDVDLAVEIFHMLADRTRLVLLWLLLDGERSVNDLVAGSGKSQSGVSQHLARLRAARLVQTRRQGTQVFYRVDSDHVRQLVRDGLHHAEHASDGVPRHHRSDAVLTDVATTGRQTRRGGRS